MTDRGPTDEGLSVAELEDLYNSRILELAAANSHGERLSAPDATATAQSKLCGSVVTVDVVLRDGRVTGYGQTVRACLLGQAASSVLAREIEGTTPAELRAVRETMRRMLKEEGAPPDGRWADLAVLEPVRAHKGRHASVLLPFDATLKAIDEIETRAPASRDAGAGVPS